MTHIVGNIVGDIEVRFTQGGMQVATFTVAENRRERNPKTKEWEEVPSFFDVVTKFELADHVAESLAKGTLVVCVGEFVQRKWVTKDGENRSKIEFLADHVGPSLRAATVVVTKKPRAGKEVARKYTEEEQEPF